LLVTDIMMPMISGWGLAERIASLRLEAKVFYGDFLKEEDISRKQ